MKIVNTNNNLNENSITKEKTVEKITKFLEYTGNNKSLFKGLETIKKMPIEAGLARKIVMISDGDNIEASLLKKNTSGSEEYFLLQISVFNNVLLGLEVTKHCQSTEYVTSLSSILYNTVKLMERVFSNEIDFVKCNLPLKHDLKNNLGYVNLNLKDEILLINGNKGKMKVFTSQQSKFYLIFKEEIPQNFCVSYKKQKFEKKEAFKISMNHNKILNLDLKQIILKQNSLEIMEMFEYNKNLFLLEAEFSNSYTILISSQYFRHQFLKHLRMSKKWDIASFYTLSRIYNSDYISSSDLENQSFFDIINNEFS